MPATLTSLVPLLACPLGMAAMMGIPAIARRVRNRRRAGYPPSGQES
jgi:hypothetical protein